AAGARGVALRAALRDPAGTVLPDPAERGWMRSELAVMRALSGPYSERARRNDPDPSPLLPDAPERVDPGVTGPPPDEVDRPDGCVFRDDQDGLTPAPDRPDRPGEPVPSPATETQHESPGAEQHVQSTTTATPAHSVNVPRRNRSFVGRQAL